MNGFTKLDEYKVATLLPLYGGKVMKKSEIMDEAEKKYLNQNHPDFKQDIPSGGMRSGRKHEEWAIHNAKGEEEGLVTTLEPGYYKITEKGKKFIEDFSAVVDDIELECTEREEPLLTETALHELNKIYNQFKSDILARQAAELYEKISNQ